MVEDFDFVFALHRAAMRAYIEPIWGWHEEWQAEYLRRKYEPQRYQIIRIEGQDAGVLVVEQRPDEVYLGLIELWPSHQGNGIGTDIITRLRDAAHASGRPLALHVLKTNTPARRLYERLGFETVEEEETRYRMRCAPPVTGNKSGRHRTTPSTAAPAEEIQ